MSGLCDVSGNFPGLVLCVSSSMHVNKKGLHTEPTGEIREGGGGGGGGGGGAP